MRVLVCKLVIIPVLQIIPTIHSPTIVLIITIHQPQQHRRYNSQLILTKPIQPTPITRAATILCLTIQVAILITRIYSILETTTTVRIYLVDLLKISPICSPTPLQIPTLTLTITITPATLITKPT